LLQNTVPCCQKYTLFTAIFPTGCSVRDLLCISVTFHFEKLIGLGVDSGY